MTKKAIVQLPGKDLVVSVEASEIAISDHFEELKVTDNSYIKDMLRDSENGVFIDTDMMIYCVISTDCYNEDLYAIYGSYLEEYIKFDGYKEAYSPHERHNIITEQIEDFIEYHSSLAIGDLALCYVIIETKPVITEIVNGHIFAQSKELEFYDSCGSVEVDFANYDYDNVLQIVRDCMPELPESHIKEIKSQLIVGE